MNRQAAAIVFILACASAADAQQCYRREGYGFRIPSGYAQHSYQSGYAADQYYGGYAYPYYTPVYQPVILEVEVQRERYYSLSDLYRDNLQFEMWKMMTRWQRDQQAKGLALADADGGDGYGGQPAADAQQGAYPQPGRAAKPARQAAAQPAAAAQGGPVAMDPKLLGIVKAKCATCHAAGNPYADFSRPERLTSAQWHSAYSLVREGDMPPPDDSGLYAPGKENELLAWKKQNALPAADAELFYQQAMRAMFARKK